MLSIPLMVLLGVISLIGLVALFGAFFTVHQQTIGIIERFGKFKRLASPGLGLKIPLIDKVVARPSLRVQQLDVAVETKTKDNVFVKTMVSVQYGITEPKVRDAYYKLQDPHRQIQSYIFDVVRAEIPKLKLDEVFERKDDVANAVKKELSEVMDDFGYSIVKALVTDIDPDSKVKDSMNNINAAQRDRIAAEERGEAEKTLSVKKAEAEARSKQLQGEGIANQRRAIVDGLRDSVHQFQEGIPGATAEDVMNLVLVTQYFDMLESLGRHGKTNTVFLDHSPAGMSDVRKQMTKALFVPRPDDATAPALDEAPHKGAGKHA